MNQRSAFVLDVRPERIEEYIEAHRAVWPEMLDALRRAGIRNYTIFRNGNQVFGYFESDDLEAASRFMAEQDVSGRWQDAMAESFSRTACRTRVLPASRRSSGSTSVPRDHHGRPRARARRRRMTTVRFLGPDTDAYVASVQRHAAEFEEQTGHRLEIRDRPERPLLLEPDRAPARRRRAPPTSTCRAGARLGAPRRRASSSRSTTSSRARATATTSADFFEPLLGCNRWSGRFGDPLGEGPLLEIPVNCESYNLAYVPDVLERAGVDVPQTWDEYFAAARTIVERTDGAVRGFGQRGTERVAHDVHGLRDPALVVRRRDFVDGRCALAAPGRRCR